MIKISVRVKPNSKIDVVEKITETEYTVRVKAPAREGKANEALIEALSEYFGIAKTRVNITGGLGSKNKVVTIS